MTILAFLFTSFYIEIEGHWFLRKRSIPRNQVTIASAKFFAFVIGYFLLFHTIVYPNGTDVPS